MKIDILTLFPEMCEAVLSESIIGRARQEGKVEINCIQIRDYSKDKHNRVDDAPYGGGTGMIMQVQPVYDCYESLCEERGERPHLIFMSPQGKTLTQLAKDLVGYVRDLLVVKTCKDYKDILKLPVDQIKELETLSAKADNARLIEILSNLSVLDNEFRYTKRNVRKIIISEII